jgi:phosphoglycerate dehydrogenase-like enzyme
MKDLKTCRILVTPTSFGRGDPTLKTELEAQVGEIVYNTTGRPLTSADLANLLPGCDGYVAGLDTIDRAAIFAADCLKVIARYGVGVDNVDLGAARERGITVTNGPGANSVSVAELAIGMMLSLARNITEACAATRRGEWPRLNGISLEGKRVGLLGLGAIGELVAQDELLAQADFLSLHLPLLPETANLVNEPFLARMKPGAFLINTSRGELIDEPALVDALKSGRLRGAALDAFIVEPPEAGNPLLSLPQVLLTPHTGAHTDGAIRNMGRMAVEGCLAVLRGEKPRYLVI